MLTLDDIPNLSEIISQGKQMLGRSYSPYSEFRVSAIILSKNKTQHNGCNIENSSYSLTVCAEVTAICNMVSSGHTAIAAAFIFSDSPQFVTPCGGCRQCILEFSKEDIPIYLVNSLGNIRQHTLSSLLPNAFNLESMGSLETME